MVEERGRGGEEVDALELYLPSLAQWVKKKKQEEDEEEEEEEGEGEGEEDEDEDDSDVDEGS